MTTTDHTALDVTIAGLGLTYNAQFVPTSQPADKVKSPQLHWTITLTKGRQSIEVPYHQGCGHVKAYDTMPTKSPYDRRRKAELVRQTCETGKLYKYMVAVDHLAVLKDPQPVPSLRDVLYCLVMDASVLDSGGFEDWASECGYETDSRQAEATYRACLEQSLKLKAMVGEKGLGELREAYQDY